MKQSSMTRRSIQVLAATALLTSSASVSSAWAQTERISNPPPTAAEAVSNPRFAQRTQLALAPTIQFPGKNAHVTTPLTVSGTAQAGSKVQVTVKGNWELRTGKSNRRASRVLGNSTVAVNAQNQWKTAPIKLDVPKNAQKVSFEISAVQLYADGRKSPASIVTAQPALKALAASPPTVQATLAPMLSITSPKNGDKVPGSFTLTGTATEKKVDVQVTAYVHSETGGVLSSKQKTVRQIQRQINGVSVKNGVWSTPINVPISGKNITRVRYVIYVTMAHSKGNLSRDIEVTRR